MIQSGTAVWFARHESRLAWRDFVAMMTAGKAARRRRVALGMAGFVVGMHVVAYFAVASVAGAVVDKRFLIGVTATVLLAWLLMVSQAMESITRAFYARADLDLILASPVAARRLFAVRIVTAALAVAAMALPLAGPFIDMLAVRGGPHWLAAYGVIVAMGAGATAVAVALTVALFRFIGPKRTRLAAQMLAAIIGAAFVIGLQVGAILSYGTLSRADVLQSQTLEALAPGLASALWWPARAALGDSPALAAVLVASLMVLAVAIALVAPRFGEVAVAASGAGASPAARSGRAARFRVASPRAALRRKEWLLLRRDPWLASQTLMQILYLLPPAVLLRRTFEAGGGAINLLVPVLVMAAGQLAGGLAWLSISGEDASDLVATAPIPQAYVLRAKIEAVIAIIAAIFAPLVAVIAVASPWHGLVTGAGIVIAAGCATAIQLWFRTQAKRSQFRRRQVSSRIATFAEAFSSIGWAATAAIVAISPLLAVPPGLLALALVIGTRLLAPRQAT
jgi:ABC-2 type transport system permease protein